MPSMTKMINNMIMYGSDWNLIADRRMDREQQILLNTKIKDMGAKRGKGHGKYGGVPGQAKRGRPPPGKRMKELDEKRYVKELDFGYYGYRWASRKEFDHSPYQRSRAFAEKVWNIYGMFGCRYCVEGTVDNRFLNRAKVEKQRKINKKITKEMMEI